MAAPSSALSQEPVLAHAALGLAVHDVAATNATDAPKVRVAVWGCGHGELDRVYEALDALTTRAHTRPADILLCCGDFEAMRNEQDLACMACPLKYREMKNFWKYYSGELVAPVLTLCVGGNHEASNHMQELPHGGWLAPNIFYLGTTGVFNFRGLRIAGVSGIFSHYNFREGYYERAPYTDNSLKSVFHTREFDLYRLHQMSGRIDILMSHDWPTTVATAGDTAELLRIKPLFRAEVQRGDLGSKPHSHLLAALQPRFWFAAHLHIKYPAIIQHPPLPDGSRNVTRFLALDKCLPQRQFMQVLDMRLRPEAAAAHAATGSCRTLCYDAEWLAILRRTHGLIPTGQRYPSLPPAPPVATSELDWINARCGSVLGSPALPVGEIFFATVAPFVPPHAGATGRHVARPAQAGNPQMDLFLDMLQLPHVFTIPFWDAGPVPAPTTTTQYAHAQLPTAFDPAEIDLDATPAVAAVDPAEIDLDAEPSPLARIESSTSSTAMPDPAEISLDGV